MLKNYSCVETVSALEWHRGVDKLGSWSRNCLSVCLSVLTAGCGCLNHHIHFEIFL